MGQSDRPGMTVGRKVAYAIAVLVVLLLAAYLFGLYYPLGDEPPIRVKNGSIVIELGEGEWENGGDDSWSPSKGKHTGDFLVRVDGPGKGDCEKTSIATGKMVDLSYSASGGVSFQAGRKHPIFWPLRTQVRQQKALKLSESKRQLTYPDPPTNDKGYISEIAVIGGGAPWTCSFELKDDNLVISICSSPSILDQCRY